jgi:hypothetical protein
LKQLTDTQVPLPVAFTLFFLIVMSGHLLGDPGQPLFGRVIVALSEFVATLGILICHRQEDPMDS